MIIQENKSASDVCIGDIQATSYRISTSGKLFDILSSNIYSNKMLAPIRELLCNAWDAHIAAGTTDKEILVHLPDADDHTFSVRDYGTGLSFDQLHTLYTTYGASSKELSNDFTGCLGLGSKSPLAYVSSFVSISFYNGKKYTCRTVKSDGAPVIYQPKDGADTDEPNGLCVSFEVPKNDIYAFQETFRKFCLAFHGKIVYPNGNGPAKQELVPEDGTNVVLVKRGLSGYSITEPCVIMGGVAYDIAKLWYGQVVQSVYDAVGVDKPTRAIINKLIIDNDYRCHPVILAEMGAIEFDAAREHCASTVRSVTYLVTSLKNFLDRKAAKFLESIEGLTPIRKLAEFWKQPSFVRDLPQVDAVEEDFLALCKNFFDRQKTLKDGSLATLEVTKRSSSKKSYAAHPGFPYSFYNTIPSTGLTVPEDPYSMWSSNNRVASLSVDNGNTQFVKMCDVDKPHYGARDMTKGMHLWMDKGNRALVFVYPESICTFLEKTLGIVMHSPDEYVAPKVERTYTPRSSGRTIKTKGFYDFLSTQYKPERYASLYLTDLRPNFYNICLKRTRIGEHPVITPEDCVYVEGCEGVSQVTLLEVLETYPGFSAYSNNENMHRFCNLVAAFDKIPIIVNERNTGVIRKLKNFAVMSLPEFLRSKESELMTRTEVVQAMENKIYEALVSADPEFRIPGKLIDKAVVKRLEVIRKRLEIRNSEPSDAVLLLSAMKHFTLDDRGPVVDLNVSKNSMLLATKGYGRPVCTTVLPRECVELVLMINFAAAQLNRLYPLITWSLNSEENTLVCDSSSINFTVVHYSDFSHVPQYIEAMDAWHKKNHTTITKFERKRK